MKCLIVELEGHYIVQTVVDRDIRILASEKFKKGSPLYYPDDAYVLLILCSPEEPS